MYLSLSQDRTKARKKPPEATRKRRPPNPTTKGRDQEYLPSLLRLKKYGGLPLLGLVPASSRVGRPREGALTTRGIQRVPDCSSCAQVCPAPLHVSSWVAGSAFHLCVIALVLRLTPSHLLLTQRVVGADQLMGATHHLGCGSNPTHGRYLPLASACPACDALKDTPKKTPCNSVWWWELKVQSEVLPCVLARWRLRRLPSVVAGSSSDCGCTGDKGQCLTYCVQQAPDSAMIPHRGVSLGPRRDQGCLST